MTKREYKKSLKSIKRNANFAKKNDTHKPIHSNDYSHLSDKHKAKMEKKDQKLKIKEQKASLKKQYKDTKPKFKFFGK